MADTCLNMSKDSGLPEECREARRRSRKAMGRMAAICPEALPPQPDRGRCGAFKRRRVEVADDKQGDDSHRSYPAGSRFTALSPLAPSAASSLPTSSSTTLGSGVPEAPVVPSTFRREDAANPAPEFGSVSLAGRSREMEDTVSLRPCFFSLGGDCAWPLHFFAVFDGHGGTDVSELCKEQMHVILAEELRQVGTKNGGGRVTADALSAAMMRCFRQMDELALSVCAFGSVGKLPCGCDHAGLSSHIVGSTAVVVVVDRDRILVANCGDSRAVLSRGGRAVPVSHDHKPDRPDELARIEAAGGRVIYVNGARVLGILAMSRALGDKYLKPIVTAEPEINIIERTPEDEFLVIASDGLWDVVSNDLACSVARRCLQDGSLQEGGQRVPDAVELGTDHDPAVEQVEAPHSYCSIAATLLTRLALGRKSADNISVIVVDLRRRWWPTGPS